VSVKGQKIPLFHGSISVGLRKKADKEDEVPALIESAAAFDGSPNPISAYTIGLISRLVESRTDGHRPGTGSHHANFIG